MDGFANIGLIAVFFLVLLAPFLVRQVEHNLEIFLFACGVIALTIAGFASIPGQTTGWTIAIVEEALAAPLRIAEVFGIPIGIVQIVLVIGLVIYFWHELVQRMIRRVVGQFPFKVLVFGLVVALGILSSVISAIIASIVLIEILCALPLERRPKIDLTVVSCFSIGLGAALTPLGEPLSTIAIAKLSGPPYYAGFTFLFDLLAIYLIPGIIAFGLLGVVFVARETAGKEFECVVHRESLRTVVIRAIKVYVFILALVFLGEGFKPLILQYIIQIPAGGLYWVNIVSAILDNATLAAAEIGPALSLVQIKAALMGLLISGGMLIPGNIPNIIAAGKLEITSREWARSAVPVGIVAMAIYFAVLFLPAYLIG